MEENDKINEAPEGSEAETPDTASGISEKETFADVPEEETAAVDAADNECGFDEFDLAPEEISVPADGAEPEKKKKKTIDLTYTKF